MFIIEDMTEEINKNDLEEIEFYINKTLEYFEYSEEDYFVFSKVQHENNELLFRIFDKETEQWENIFNCSDFNMLRIVEGEINFIYLTKKEQNENMYN